MLLKSNRKIGIFVIISIIMCLFVFVIEETHYVPQSYSITDITPSVDNPVNLNTATQSELDSLPGIGPVTAGKIIKFRTEERAFETVYDIKLVPGIGEETFADICHLVCVE